MESIKVEFKGGKYWLMSGSLEKSGALAPLDHCDEKGEILPEAVFQDSFAHYFIDQGIMRYREKIGDKEDLKIV